MIKIRIKPSLEPAVDACVHYKHIKHLEHEKCKRDRLSSMIRKARDRVPLSRVR